MREEIGTCYMCFKDFDTGVCGPCHKSGVKQGLDIADHYRDENVQLRASIASFLACVTIGRHNDWRIKDIGTLYDAAEAAAKKLGGAPLDAAREIRNVIRTGGTSY